MIAHFLYDKCNCNRARAQLHGAIKEFFLQIAWSFQVPDKIIYTSRRPLWRFLQSNINSMTHLMYSHIISGQSEVLESFQGHSAATMAGAGRTSHFIDDIEWYWCKMWILRNFARKPGVLFSAASMATREFTCRCIHILQISNMLIRSCPAVSCYLSACFFWSFSSSPAPQLDETLEWWCKETPSFAYAEEKHDPFGAVFTSPGWSFQLSELLELLELFLGNQMLICMRMKHTCLHETRWSLFKNKRLKIRFTNTRYDVPKRSALAHGMQCHPFRIWHIVKYIYTTLEATYMKRMQCHAASTI